MREGEEVFEGCVAVGLCAEYLMQVSPSHRVQTRRYRLVVCFEQPNSVYVGVGLY